MDLGQHTNMDIKGDARGLVECACRKEGCRPQARALPHRVLPWLPHLVHSYHTRACAVRLTQRLTWTLKGSRGSILRGTEEEINTTDLKEFKSNKEINLSYRD
ncbi:hypothetical protein H6P81_010552 [Aristolochia fimbriata]|uniref:Uncharacterized protein n=1 Tax=Aristolochia fimbriata TaxID=158543 RepID=A0AAV7ESE6_ARIFI|nr:hypothetical protein H6P81_010552 [Aristolochia fimbriata]